MLFEKKMADSDGSKYTLPCTRQADMYVHWRANIEVDDNDLFEIHDCFTSSECGTISVFSLTETGK